VKRGFGVILGGLVSLGCLAAIPAIGVPAGVASPSLRAATLAAYPANKSADNKSVVNKSAGGNSVVPEVGNPNGHVTVPVAGREVSTSHPNHVIGHGTPAGCTSAAVVKAVAEGGIITFDCGPKPVTILMKATAKVVNTSHRVCLTAVARSRSAAAARSASCT